MARCAFQPGFFHPGLPTELACHAPIGSRIRISFCMSTALPLASWTATNLVVDLLTAMSGEHPEEYYIRGLLQAHFAAATPIPRRKTAAQHIKR